MSNIIEKDVVIIGGGLAGLTAAATLAKEGKKVVLLEKSVLGGRALTMQLKGFSFNFGAHAVYAKDKSMINVLERELSLHLDWKKFSQGKAKYDTGDFLTEIPANLSGLLKTKMVTGINKYKFSIFVLKTLFGVQKYKENETIKEWMDRKAINNQLRTMILTLASSNFFTNEPEKINAKIFFDYYKRVFSTKQPVTYLKGGWISIVTELKRVIEENGGEIITKARVNELLLEESKLVAIKVKEDEYKAKQFILAIPPGELAKLFNKTEHYEYFKGYADFKPNNVIYYDIGLRNRVNGELTYVYDLKNKVFITDISYYDKECTPEGGQLLQAISYINEKQTKEENYFEDAKEKIEKLFDKHFDGWREELIVNRLSKGASVQEIKWEGEQKPLPIKYDALENVWFAGDWCVGTGQLSELSVSSALEVSEKIKNQV